MGKKLPTGIQSFEKMRTDGFAYVDKTAFIYQLAHQNVPYFLSRPRRFGKSLLLSTMRAYWEGKKELFSGLEIEKLERGNTDAWQMYPVFYFDFNGQNYSMTDTLDKVLDGMLQDWEARYRTQQFQNRTLGDRFYKLLEQAHIQSGLRCVVLVDEYDKPLLDLLDFPEKVEHNKLVFKSFFSMLKKADEHIHFIFITGVTKFNKVSIFSDLNQLEDISTDEEYAEICGITEAELRTYFTDELQGMAQTLGISAEECIEKLRKTYDGYHFSSAGTGIFNPYSLLSALKKKKTGYYWFETGTPTFLISRLKERSTDIRHFTDQTLYVDERMLMDYRAENLDILPLLYQTGYLTITGFDRIRNLYILGFPNEEVQFGLLECLMPAYVPGAEPDTGLDIYSLERCFESGDLEGIRRILTSLFASIPYTTVSAPFEHYFQTVLFIIFTLLKRFAQCELHTSTGRIDCIVKTAHFIYLFEFKRDSSALAALKQIEENHYTVPFEADMRTLYCIGVNFDSESRMLTEWEVANQII